MKGALHLPVFLLLSFSASAFVEELDDMFMETKGAEEIWLIKLYAPWCSFCKQLAPVWRQVGAELRSVGSTVHVGQADATMHTGFAKELRVTGYPAIMMLKKDMTYQYQGPRRKDNIIEFANRVAGPEVRVLSTLQLFQHVRSRIKVLFLYVGASSPLKGAFVQAAKQMISHTNFFSASREILPKTVSIASLPAVLVFKDGTFLTYSEETDGPLDAWIQTERFPTVSRLDSYTLYALGDTGRLVVLALLDEMNWSESSKRSMTLLEQVASDHQGRYRRNFYFGYMEGNEYIKGLVMGEVMVPSFLVLNLSNDGYFLPPAPVEVEPELLDFLDGVLNGTLEIQGGNTVVQRFRRFVYDAQNTLMPLGCLILCAPVGVLVCLGYHGYRRRVARQDTEDGDKKTD